MNVMEVRCAPGSARAVLVDSCEHVSEFYASLKRQYSFFDQCDSRLLKEDLRLVLGTKLHEGLVIAEDLPYNRKSNIK